MYLTQKILYFAMVWALLLTGCSPMEESEKDKLRKMNEVSEVIYRLDEEHFFHANEVIVANRETYPWEPKSLTVDKKITKEHFRCRGSAQNGCKSLIDAVGDKTKMIDCGGMEKHGLPYREEGEFIYPALIEILNYIQEKVGRRVVITTGHRCPAHNQFADPSPANLTSKHQMGAEVDFYVEGYEEAPLEIVRWVMHYYAEHPELHYSSFKESKAKSNGLRHSGWYNGEISINIKEKSEGRDFDNRHPYPYITIELRLDRSEHDKPVEYNWHRANNNYIRF